MRACDWCFLKRSIIIYKELGKWGGKALVIEEFAWDTGSILVKPRLSNWKFSRYEFSFHPLCLAQEILLCLCISRVNKSNIREPVLVHSSSWQRRQSKPMRHIISTIRRQRTMNACMLALSSFLPLLYSGRKWAHTQLNRSLPFIIKTISHIMLRGHLWVDSRFCQIGNSYLNAWSHFKWY